MLSRFFCFAAGEHVMEKIAADHIGIVGYGLSKRKNKHTALDDRDNVFFWVQFRKKY